MVPHDNDLLTNLWIQKKKEKNNIYIRKCK